MLAYFVPSRRSLTRRALLVGTAALAGCARHKSRGFPGYAFVANAGARTVAAGDLNAFALAKQISLDSAPGAVLSNPLRPGVYVLMPESGAVCEIDATKLAVVRTTRLGNPAVAMRLTADGKSLWVLQARALVRLEGNRLWAVESIALPGVAGDFDLTSDGRAAVSFREERRLALVRLGTGTIEHLIDAGCEPSLVRFQGDGKQVLVGSRADRSRSVFDAASGRTAVRTLAGAISGRWQAGVGGESRGPQSDHLRRGQRADGGAAAAAGGTRELLLQFRWRPDVRHRSGNGCGGDRVSVPDRSGRDDSGRADAGWHGGLGGAAVPVRGEPRVRERHGAGYRHAQTGGGDGRWAGAAAHSDYAG